MDTKRLGIGLKEVFSEKPYVALSVLGALIIFLFAIYLNNIKLSNYILATSDFTIAQKMSIFYEIAIGLPQSAGAYFAYSLPVIAILFGINIALIAYTYKNITIPKTAGAGGGLLVGLLGVGCPACGSALLSLIGLTGVIAALPLRGFEISAISIMILAGSIYYIAKNIDCEDCRIG